MGRNFAPMLSLRIRLWGDVAKWECISAMAAERSICIKLVIAQVEPDPIVEAAVIVSVRVSNNSLLTCLADSLA